MEIRVGPSGGVNNTKIRLPKTAVIQNATMTIGCSGPVAFDQYATFTGAAAGDHFGFSVSDAGDVNNDGYNDVIVGARGNDEGGNEAGRAYIYYSGASMDSTADVILTGAAAYDWFGHSVSSAGDVNSDGYDDVVVGALGNDEGGSEAGRAYIYYGGASMDSTADVTLTGAAAGDYFGYSVSGAKDVNKDGYDDVIVSAYFNDAGGTEAGRAYIYFGAASMDSTADVLLTGAAAFDNFGESVSCAGDVNKDGYDDVIVGAVGNDAGGSEAGRAYIYYGGASMDSTADVIFTGAAADDRFGGSVSGAGDVNKDGYDDVAVGAHFNDAGGSNAGRVYIHYGGASMDSAADVIFTGVAESNAFGTVSGAGDVNNDGFDDVIVGAVGNDAGGTDSGQAYIYLGAASMDSAADVTLTGAAANDWFGSPVSGAGDVDNDGCDEIIVSASGDDAGGTDAGSAIVFKFDKTFIGVQEVNVSVGPISIWNDPWFENGANLSRDFGPELDQLVRDSPSSGGDKYGNSYVDVPVQVSARAVGNFTLGKLKIIYSLDATVGDFTDELSQYIAAHKAEKDASGNISIPIRVASGTPGRLELNDLLIIIDEAPRLVKPLPDVELAEDSAESRLLDLLQYFEDDYDTKDQLTFGMVSSTNGSLVKVEVAGNRFVSADASEGMQNDNWTGVVDVIVKAADRSGFTRQSNPFRIIVANVNDAPIITSLPPTSGTVGQVYPYQVVAVDGDKDPLTYALVKKPENMTISAGGRISWIPSRDGIYNVSVTVGDGNATAYQDFTIDVTPNGTVVQNRPPRFTSVPVMNATVGIQYLYEARATDDDKDALSFSLVNKPGGMSIDPATGRISWTPNASQTGNHTITVIVTDGKGGAALQEFTINVTSKGKLGVEFITPSEGQKVKGKFTVTGVVIKGANNTTKVQLRVDSGAWMDAAGTLGWQITIDTTKLKNGKHTLQARAYAGMDYSDAVNRTIKVDNAQPSGKGFIPGFEVLPMILAAAALLLLKRKWK